MWKWIGFFGCSAVITASLLVYGFATFGLEMIGKGKFSGEDRAVVFESMTHGCQEHAIEGGSKYSKPALKSYCDCYADAMLNTASRRQLEKDDTANIVMKAKMDAAIKVCYPKLGPRVAASN